MKQTRFISADTCGLRVREAEDGQQSRTVEGTPIVFGVRSVNLTPWSETREVYEVLEPGCISEELLQRSDVILNLNHSNMVPDVLGRCKNGNGTLSLRLAPDHIECRCELPHTNNANDTLELMRRGDITGMSFAFEDDYADSENGVSYERTAETRNGKEVWLRHVKRIIGLYDVAIVTHPAYEQTSVGVRELGDVIDKAIDLQIEIEKREAEEEQKRACGGKDDKRNEDPEDMKDTDPDDMKDTDPDDMEEDDEEQERERMIAMQHRRSMRRHLVERMIDSL